MTVSAKVVASSEERHGERHVMKEAERSTESSEGMPSLQQSGDGTDNGQMATILVDTHGEKIKTTVLRSEPDEADPTVPMVTLEHATPSPQPSLRAADENNNDKKDRVYDNEDEDDEDEYDEDDEGDEEEDLEEEEEEEEDKEMTPEEKKEMYEAVKSGDIDLLEDCLEKPNADIQMTWFRENLLMTAIRESHQEMAEFLLDIGVDHTFSTSVVSLREMSKGKVMDRYQLSCRQMAYDKEMYDVVELIDILQGRQLYPFVRPSARVPRLRRLKAPSSVCDGSESARPDRRSADGSRSDIEGSEEGNAEQKAASMRVKKKKKLKTASETELDGVEKDRADGSSLFGEGFDVDSGHHSMGSNKLKIAMVREHDRLTERDENVLSSEGAPSPGRPSRAGSEGRGGGGKGGEGGNKSTTHSSTARSDAVESQARDEGYGSTCVSVKSLAPSVSPDAKSHFWALAEPVNKIRSTRSTVALQMMNKSRRNNGVILDLPPHSIYRDRPLRWRKVSTFGSYAKESKNWHIKNDEIVEKLDAAITSSDSDTGGVGVGSGGSGSFQVTSEEISRIELSTPPASTSPSMKTVRFSISSTVSAATTATNGPRPDSDATVTTDKPIAGYMRPTKSTATKQRLSPHFVKSYGGLEFTHALASKQSEQSCGKGYSPAPGPPTSLSIRNYSLPNLTSVSVLQRRNNKSMSFRS